MIDYYDRQGQAMTREDFSEKFSDMSYKRVAEDTIDNKWISTVWLGLNHSFTDDGPALIFETMVFPRGENEEGWSEQFCDRYATEEEALAGHERVCEAIREGKDLYDL